MSGVPDLPGFDAVIVAGGRGERLGGVDKAALTYRGTHLLDRVIGAARGAGRVVVVGPPRPTPFPVLWTREEPPGGGPVAALEAGLARVEASLVVVLAVDLPLLDGAFIARLVRAADADTAAVAQDASGTLQPLLACYPTVPLTSALEATDAAGRSMMALLERLAHRTIPDEGRARDCDTLDDLEELRIERDGGDHAGRLA